MNSTDTEKHKKSILEAINELAKLQSRTCSPAPIQHQFIGTALDNSLGLLTAPANALGERINFSFTEFDNWLSLMKSVHRSFCSQVHTCLEKGREKLVLEWNLNVESSIKKQYSKQLEAIRPLVPESDTSQNKAFMKLEKYFNNFKPSFSDTINTVIKASKLTKERKAVWRAYFDALTIARNKSSHSEPALSKNEIEKLKKGGFESLVYKDSTFQCNPRYYVQIGTHCLDFFDELLVSYDE